MASMTLKSKLSAVAPESKQLNKEHEICLTWSDGNMMAATEQKNSNVNQVSWAQDGKSVTRQLSKGADVSILEAALSMLSLQAPTSSIASVATLDAGLATLTKFHFFTRMPSELQLKVWKLIESEPRVVQLRYSNRICHAISPNSAPALLHVCVSARKEAMNQYTLLFKPLRLTPRIWIDPKIDTLYFDEKVHGDYNVILSDHYVDYFKTLTKNIQPKVFENLSRLAINEQIYSHNQEWDFEREDMFHLSKFEKLDIAAIVLDAGKKLKGPVKLVQVTFNSCPYHSSAGLTNSVPDFDGDEVLHGCALCVTPFLVELRRTMRIDNIYFRLLERGLTGMFENIKEEQAPNFKVPKTKTMAMAEKEQNVKLGQCEHPERTRYAYADHLEMQLLYLMEAEGARSRRSRVGR